MTRPKRRAPLPRSFFDRPVHTLARDLLGCVLWAGDVGVRLTEVEAYDGQADPASHAFRGRSPRNAVMFGPPGHLYVYFTYGMHFCVNVVAGHAEGEAAAVLLRAGEVVDGIEVARERRPAVSRDRDLARGPARLTMTLQLGREHNGADLTQRTGAVQLVSGLPVAADRVRCGPRVGVSAAADRPWRYWIDADPTVSDYRPAAPRRRRATGER